MPASVKKKKLTKAEESRYKLRDNTKSNKTQKIIERSLMLFALVGTVTVVSLYSDLFSRLITTPTPNSMLYGTWVEQNVASYSADKFVLSKQGVAVNGAIISTDYEFDGKYFEYKAGGKDIRYKVTNKDVTEMMLETKSHYQPLFKRKGLSNSNTSLR